jgi:8-oxo-dGTP pyrophosphatase MutT (NUDIX family)
MSPAVPLPAATLLLVRDGARGLEVLMTTRHAAAGFAAGALVFPGGKVEAADAALRPRCAGLDGIDAANAAYRVAAVRETFEECGMLLARRDGFAELICEAELDALRAAGAAGLAALLEAEGLTLACDMLAPFAHWITPVDRPKRFDTHFFIAAAPPDQQTRHDGREAVDARWVAPAEVIAEADAGRVNLVFATRMNLLRLARSRSSIETLEAARRDPIVTVLPEVVRTAAGVKFRIPLEAGYGAAEIPAVGIKRA